MRCISMLKVGEFHILYKTSHKFILIVLSLSQDYDFFSFGIINLNGVGIVNSERLEDAHRKGQLGISFIPYSHI